MIFVTCPISIRISFQTNAFGTSTIHKSVFRSSFEVPKNMLSRYPVLFTNHRTDTLHNFCFSNMGVTVTLKSLIPNFSSMFVMFFFRLILIEPSFLSIFMPKNQLSSQKSLTRNTFITFSLIELRKESLLPQ